jgi:acyl-coenzyme A synthetase/AMP-(fatty) acid ligase
MSGEPSRPFRRRKDTNLAVCGRRSRYNVALRRAIDPLFLPRPLKLVEALPRNETGKLPRAALLALLGQHDG